MMNVSDELSSSPNRGKPCGVRLMDVWRTGALLVIMSVVFSGCGTVFKKRPPTKRTSMDLIGEPIPPEQAKEVLSEVGKNFAYGTGIGDTALNVGAIVAFPPYAIYVVGNALLAVTGYETITPSKVLPKKAGESWAETYDTIVSGPGRMVAALAGHEYRSEVVKEQKLQAVFKKIEQANQQQEDGSTR